MSFFNLACRSSSFGDDEGYEENDARRRWKQQEQVHSVFFEVYDQYDYSIIHLNSILIFILKGRSSWQRRNGAYFNYLVVCKISVSIVGIDAHE